MGASASFLVTSLTQMGPSRHLVHRVTSESALPRAPRTLGNRLWDRHPRAPQRGPVTRAALC